MPTSSPAEFNTIITMLGCLCAVVQFITGYYAFYYKKKKALLKINNTLHRTHTTFGDFATAFYGLGLFAGLSGFILSIVNVGMSVPIHTPPIELLDFTYNLHVWASFVIMGIILLKTYLSYFHKQTLYRRMKYLGPATFIAWAYTWITSALSYYVRTIPPNEQHPDPFFLLPIHLFALQVVMPFIIGGLIGFLIVYLANKAEKKKS